MGTCEIGRERRTLVFYADDEFECEVAFFISFFGDGRQAAMRCVSISFLTFNKL
jgi:hypothetical protein